MPSIADQLPETTPKAMNRRLSRSAVVWSVSRAKYMGSVLPKLDRHMRQLSASLDELKEPVEMIVGSGENQQVAHIKNYAAQAKIASALLAVVEMQRSLLGFPSPGKRRDEGQADGLKSAQSPGIVDVAQVQAAASSAGQAGQTGSATAGEAEQAEPITPASQPTEQSP